MHRMSRNDTGYWRVTHELELVTGDIRNVHVMGGGGDIFLYRRNKNKNPSHAAQLTIFLPVKIY